MAGRDLRSASLGDLQLSVSAGPSAVRAFLSGSSYTQDGIVIGSGYKRQAARLNLDASATSKLSLSTSIGLTREENDRVPGDLNVDGVVTNALAEQPFNPIYGSSFGFGGIREGVLYPTRSRRDLQLTHEHYGSRDRQPARRATP